MEDKRPNGMEDCNHLTMKNVIVTGATSMIGSSLIEALLMDSGVVRIYAVVRPGTVKIGRLPQNDRVAVIECDITEYSSLPSLINESCDIMYHLAWPRTATYEESLEDMLLKVQNLSAVLLAMEAAKNLGCRSFVGAGSQSEYGIQEAKWFSPDSPCNPVRADGVLHLAACKLAMNFANSQGIDCIWMRVFSVYGKYDRPNSMIMTTIKKLMRNEDCVFTPAEQEWDYLYADDIGKAFYLVGKKVKGSHIYCVGAGATKPLKEYIHIIKSVVMDSSAKIEIGKLPYPDKPIMHLGADISSLCEDTGWKPETSFEEGIIRIYQYMKENNF